MADTEGREWDPLPLNTAVELFRPAQFRWWISGGIALELHLGQSWRTHHDTDIGVCGEDVGRVVELLESWDFRVANDGKLQRWNAVDRRPRGNNLWCRASTNLDWQLDVTIGDGDRHRWIYRRDAAVSLPWNEAVLHSSDAVPYLAPQLQLLFKSKSIRPKDQIDAEHVIPRLDRDRLAWLAVHLPSAHPWQRILH